MQATHISFTPEGYMMCTDALAMEKICFLKDIQFSRNYCILEYCTCFLKLKVFFKNDENLHNNKYILEGLRLKF